MSVPTPSWRSRLKAAGIIIGALFALLIVIGVIVGPTPPAPETTRASEGDAPSASEAPFSQAPPPPAPEPADAVVPTDTDSSGSLTRTAWIARIVDSDTVEVRYAEVVDSIEEIETVRIIGIDGPETGQCHEVESYFFASDYLTEGEPVTLVTDPTIPDRGKYGRLLRRIETHQVGDYGLAALEAGIVLAKTYNDPPHQLAAEYEAAQARAQQAPAGLWSPQTCDGGTEKLPDADYDGIPDSQDDDNGNVYLDTDDGGYDGGVLPPECQDEVVGNGRGDC